MIRLEDYDLFYCIDPDLAPFISDKIPDKDYIVGIALRVEGSSLKYVSISRNYPSDTEKSFEDENLDGIAHELLVRGLVKDKFDGFIYKPSTDEKMDKCKEIFIQLIRYLRNKEEGKYE